MSTVPAFGTFSCGKLLCLARRVFCILFPAFFLVVSSALAEEGLVKFFTNQTQAEAGTTRIIPFSYSVKNTYSVFPSHSVFDASIIEVVKTPVILPGYDIGFVRILAKRPGETQLRIGNADLSVSVKPPAATESLTNASPTITEPVDTSIVWGPFYLTVELPNRDSSICNIQPELALEDGSSIPATLKFKEKNGNVIRYVFKMNLNAFIGFKVRLHPVLHLPDGGTLTGNTITLQPITANSENIVQSGLCTRFLKPLREIDQQNKIIQANPSAPKRSLPELPTIYHPASSGGFAVQLANNNLKWSIPVNVPQDGYYQLMLNLSGGQAFGGYASLGIYSDDKNEPLTTSRIAGTFWHRIPAGKPIKLTAGERIVSVGLLNQTAGAKQENRNLYLDRFELVRLDNYKPAKTKPVQVWFEDIVDQLAVSDTVTLKAHLIGDDLGDTKDHPPQVMLLINDRPVLSQNNINPVFKISPESFKPGPNEIQLEAVTGNGVHYRSLTQTIIGRESQPQLAILYPPANHQSGNLDTVIVSAFDPSGIKRLDLKINGTAQKLNQRPALGLGNVSLPLLLANRVNPGPVSVSVIAEANSGQITELPVSGLIFNPSLPPAQNRYARAVHLLNRLAYGPNSRDISSILTLGEEAWLQRSLTASLDDNTQKLVLEQAAIQFPDTSNSRQVVSRVAAEALITDNPLRTRFVFWLNNHFSSWIRKTEAEPKWQDYLVWDTLGPAPFNALLAASTHSPAMLIYLDQQRSYKGRINENYAREIMELHTLGVNGGYTQADVTKLARLFTGLTISSDAFPDGRGGNNNNMERQFHFAAHLNDIAAQEILGLSFNAKTADEQYDRITLALELLASHPSTAKFIAEKFGKHYIGTNLSADTITSLTNVYMQTNGDMRTMISALPGMPEFWAAMDKPRVATPLDYGIRLARSAGLTNPRPLIEYLERSGMGIFDRATPDGYPEGDENYANSNSLLQRWQLAHRLEKNLFQLVPQQWRQSANDRQWESNLIDLLSAELIGRPLSPASRQAALKVLQVPAENDDGKVQRVATFISQLPEYNLR